MVSWRSPSTILAFCLALILSLCSHCAALANFTVFDTWLPESDLGNLLPNDGSELVVNKCVYLDGRCVFKVAAPRSELETRIHYIQTQLNRVKRLNRDNQTPVVEVRSDIEAELSNVIIETGTETIRLMTVTQWDAELQGETVESRTAHIIEQLNVHDSVYTGFATRNINRSSDGNSARENGRVSTGNDGVALYNIRLSWQSF